MAQQNAADHVDVLIVGAGISGIGMAVHLCKMCKGKSFVMLEQRDNAGGTWDLFQYPGVRSDSDMHTLGYNFKPWREQKAIADGPSILNYLKETISEYKLEDHIHYGRKVLSASWSSRTARWSLTVEKKDGSQIAMQSNFLFMGSGYYNYDEAYDPEFSGSENFAGQIVHPQFWPEDFDYSGKKVVVIGSGATAVTLVPSLTDKAAHVTMLQRSPTYMFLRPATDNLANFLRKILPEETAYRFTRWKNVWLQRLMFKLARGRPSMIRKNLLKKVRQQVRDDEQMKHFLPRYNPWKQRLCLIPDNDLFDAIQADKASVVTDHIKNFDARGISLQSGDHLDADIIVTATGLKLAIAGSIDFAVDGKKIDFHEHFYYKSCMFSDIPNMSIVFGYLNASWTLKTDIVTEYSCRILNHMDATGTQIANPRLDNPDALEEEDVFDFSSGYIQRALDELPRSAVKYPWRLNQDYIEDRRLLRKGPIDDGILQFSLAHAADDKSASDALEAAE